jgi:hypothetical protein
MTRAGSSQAQSHVVSVSRCRISSPIIVGDCQHLGYSQEGTQPWKVLILEGKIQRKSAILKKEKNYR